MKVQTRPDIRRRVTIKRGALRRRGEHESHGDVIVRVALGARLYAYVVRGPVGIGDRVAVHAALSGDVVRYVVALGRGSYMGPLKRGRVVR